MQVLEQELLQEPLLLEVPNALESDRAALTEPMAVGHHAVQVVGATRFYGYGTDFSSGSGQGDANQWLRSGRVFFSPVSDDDPASAREGSPPPSVAEHGRQGG